MVAMKISTLLALLPLLAVADEGSGFTMDQNPGTLVPQIPASAKDAACTKAYKEPHLECIPEIMHSITLGNPAEVPTEEQLDVVCTNTCLKSLQRWIRGTKDCGPDKFLKFLNLSNSTTKAAGYKDADIQQFFINTVYWDKCLVDLKKPKSGGSKYCVLQWEEIIADESGNLPNMITTEKPDEFCKDKTCGAQHAFLWGPKKTIRRVDDKAETGNGTPKTDMVSLKEACPKLDTSKFPKREEDLKTSDLGTAEAVGAESNEKSDGAEPPSEKSSSEAGSKSNSGTKPEISENSAQRSSVQSGVALSALLVAAGFLLL